MINSNPKDAPNGPFVVVSRILSPVSRSSAPGSSSTSRSGGKRNRCGKRSTKRDQLCRLTGFAGRCRSGAAISGVRRYTSPVTARRSVLLLQTVVMTAGISRRWQMSAKGYSPARPRTGQQRPMTASRRRDLAIGALPRRTVERAHLELRNVSGMDA